jgi:hypothetical protein
MISLFYINKLPIFCNWKQSVTTSCLHKLNYNNAPQAPLGCPASTASYDIQSTTCLSSPYFQTAGENKPCKRTILLNHNIPILRWHTIWIFHFPQPTQVNIRWPRGNRVGKYATKSSTTQTFTTPRHTSSLPARSEHYRNYTVSFTHDLTTDLSKCLTNLRNEHLLKFHT